MVHEEILSLHIGIHTAPQDPRLTDEDRDYFWYSIASVILCHRPEWMTQEAFDFINDYETGEEHENGSTT